MSCGAAAEQTDCIPRLDVPGSCIAAERVPRSGRQRATEMIHIIWLALAAACEMCTFKLSLLSMRTPTAFCRSLSAGAKQ